MNYVILKDLKHEVKGFFVVAGVFFGVLLLMGTYIYMNVVAQAASVASVQSGSWSDPTVWSTGNVPGAADSVAIAAGHTITYDIVSNAVLGQIDITGTLVFSRATDTRLKTSDNIFVRSEGVLDMGTEDSPIPGTTKLEVIFVLPRGYAFTGGSTMKSEDKGLWAMGEWSSYGAPLLHAWVKLAQDAPAGSSVVVVENDVTDWQTGGSVVISQTSRAFRPGGKCNHDTPCSYFWENEVRIITGIQPLAGGKTQLTLDRPLTYMHKGTGETRGEAGLLTRNVLIRTEVTGVADATLDKIAGERRFAHTMLMGTAKGKIQYTEFKYMGNLATLARYPVHIHMTGKAGNGVVIRGNSIWRSGNRGYQVHNTEGVLVEDNVAFDTIMTSYYIERSGHPGQDLDRTNPAEAPHNNWLVHNLGVQSSKAPNKGSAQQNDNSIFWFDQLDQVVLGNVGVGGGANAGSGEFPQGAEQGFDGSGLFIDNRADRTGAIRPPLFLKNEFHSSALSGLLFWHVSTPPFDFVDIKAWGNHGGIDWGYYRTQHRIYQATLIDNYVGVGSRQSSSGSRFMQDVLLKDNFAALLNGTGGSLSNARPVWPDEPFTYIRPVFEGNDLGLVRGPFGCDQSGIGAFVAVGTRACDPGYVLLQDPVFKNSKEPFAFRGKTLAGNRNSYYRIENAQGLGPAFPEDFFIFREDQQNPTDQTNFDKPLLQGTKFWNDSAEGLIVPIDSSFPNQLVLPVDGFTGSNNNDGFIPAGRTYTFKKELDSPPQVSVSATTNAKVVNLTATATDDKGVTKVEFWVDDQLIATDTSAPYQASFDLSNHPRKYAYFYAKAFDGVVHKYRYPNLPSAPRGQDYEQRAYSTAVEIGPEVILAGQTVPPGTLPTPPPIALPIPPVPTQDPTNDPPTVSGGSDQTAAPGQSVFLDGIVKDDGLPLLLNNIGHHTTQLRINWSKVSGPGTISFDNASQASTNATFSAAGTYVVRLTANDGQLTATDEATVTVVTPTPISGAPYPGSSFIGGVSFDKSSHIQLAPGSDNWPITWSDDDHQYTSWGDGGGFGGTNSDGRVSLGFGRVEGGANNYQGFNVWGGKNPTSISQFGGKSYGVISINGILYAWWGPGSNTESYKNTKLITSADKGRTWSFSNWDLIDTDSALIMPTILNFGKDYAGARDNFVYHYFIRKQGNPSGLGIQKPGIIDLARVPKQDIMNRNSYEWFAGLDGSGNPIWTADAGSRKPVFQDPNGVGWNVAVSHNAGLQRYILTTEHTRSFESNLGIFDAPEPWGPWTTVGYYSNWENFPETFFWNFANKWLSKDGRDFTLVFTGTGSSDSWNSIRGRFVIARDSFVPLSGSLPTPPPPPPPPLPPATPTFIGHWAFDDGSGATAKDSSGQGNDGMLVDGSIWTTGKVGGALRFDGSNDYVETNYTTNLAQWTVAAWVKSPTAPTNAAPNGLVHKDRNFHIAWDHTNPIFRGAAVLRVGSTWHAATFGELNANTWYHLAATYDGENLKAYKNGILVTNNSSPSGVPASEGNSLKIGRHASAPQFFQGTVDEVRVYNYALSASEITDIATSPSGSPQHSSPTISTLDQFHYFIDRGKKLILTGSNFSPSRALHFRLRGQAQQKLEVQVNPKDASTVELDLSQADEFNALTPGFYDIELEQISDGTKITHTKQLLITKLGDLPDDQGGRDGKIDVDDISRFLSKFGSTNPADLADADISSGVNNSSAGRIDIFDANKLMANWTG